MNQTPTPEAVTAIPNIKEHTMSLDNLIEQPTITGLNEGPPPVTTDQPGITAPTAIATSPVEPQGSAEHSRPQPTTSLDNETEQPTITGLNEEAPQATTDQQSIAAPTTIATSPAEPQGDETTHDDPSTHAGQPCADRCSAVDSDDVENAEQPANVGVAHHALVIGIAAILVVVALIRRRRRGRSGVSP